ncbi:hypothetical protein BKA93DRAFT_346419 [Sparassis latifolia]
MRSLSAQHSRIVRRVTLSLRGFTQKLHKKRIHTCLQPASVPYIPPEVWGLIIHHACLLDYDPLVSISQLSFLDSAASHLACYRAVMRIKTTLSLVCQSWHHFAQPYLFEFVWISSAAQAKVLARTLLIEYISSSDHGTSGKYIRRLHIETPALERCAPADLRTILEYSPNISVYSDYHSVQRGVGDGAADPRCSPEAILRLVTHPKMRRLSWTSYDDLPFELRMSPFLTNVATRLEYLELSSRSSTLRGPSPDHVEFPAMAVCLPSLRALKVSLDNNTFAVLASWDMPALTNLSVLSSDFSYTGTGFAQFFHAHGLKLRQLELGHSSSLVEEYYLTTPHHLLQMQQSHTQPPPVPLAEWCPNLREFICSADAEWHWRSPDWIAPHILLPAHPCVEFIGIRDIDTRLLEDPAVPHAPADTPYFLLLEQMSSILCHDAFPSLRFVRDLSTESHRMRTVRPSERVLGFWSRVVQKCHERAVWLEDCEGVNITQRALKRAALVRD